VDPRTGVRFPSRASTKLVYTPKCIHCLDLQNRLKIQKVPNLDIYNLNRQIEQIWNQIKTEFSEDDVAELEKYEIVMVKETLAKSTRLKNLKMLLSLRRLAGKDLVTLDKNDIDKLVVRIMDTYSQSGKETETTKDHKKILKLFWRWHIFGIRSYKKCLQKHRVGDPPETQDITVKKPYDKITRESLLTDNEKLDLFNACADNPRDKALIHTILDGAIRPGEGLTLQIKHVKQDEFGTIISVDGKTGARPVRIIESAPDLHAWLAVHPFRDNVEWPLWISLAKNTYGNTLTWKAASNMIKKRCRIAQLSKRVNLKLLRHMGATESAKYLSDELMKKRHGWSRTSTMPSRYAHMINSDVDEAILKRYGISKEEETKKNKLPKICKICDMTNSPYSKTCSKCGKSLNLKDALEKETEAENSLKKMEQMILEIDSKLQRDQILHEEKMYVFRSYLDSTE